MAARSESGSESEWADWTADGEDEALNAQAYVCVACAEERPHPEALFAHMVEAHALDLLALRDAHSTRDVCA